MHPVVAHRVVDDAGDGLALAHHRRHHRKQRQAGGEIGGAVDRIDDDGELGVGQPSSSAGSAATDSSPTNSASGTSAADARP